jgi:2-phospho-L-lactate guanylyltransferase
VELSGWLLERTLRVVAALPTACCVVVSRDAAVLARAAAAGALAVPERGRTLNAALRQAVAVAAAEGADALLVLPIDLPRVEPDDLAALVAAAPPPPAVVIAPAGRGGGTNALLLRPPGVIAPAFGRASYRRHQERAGRANAAVRIIERPRLAADLDTLADLRELAPALPAAVLAHWGWDGAPARERPGAARVRARPSVGAPVAPMLLPLSAHGEGAGG